MTHIGGQCYHLTCGVLLCFTDLRGASRNGLYQNPCGGSLSTL